MCYDPFTEPPEKNALPAHITPLHFYSDSTPCRRASPIVGSSSSNHISTLLVVVDVLLRVFSLLRFVVIIPSKYQVVVLYI